MQNSWYEVVRIFSSSFKRSSSLFYLPHRIKWGYYDYMVFFFMVFCSVAEMFSNTMVWYRSIVGVFDFETSQLLLYIVTYFHKTY